MRAPAKKRGRRSAPAILSARLLDYVKLDGGQLAEATLPELKGLSMRGNWIPTFEQLVRYAE